MRTEQNTFSWLWRRLLVLGVATGACFSMQMTERAMAQGGVSQALPQEVLVNLVKPSVVRVAQHVTGTAKIPSVKVDVRSGLVAVLPNEPPTEITVDEYLTGSGFVVHSDGYIATNAHVVSPETVKLMLATESALSALFENALLLSDEEMQQFLQSDEEGGFSRTVTKYVIEHSDFKLEHRVAVLKPGSDKRRIVDLLDEGYPAETVYVNDAFADDERDIALLKIAASSLPAVALGRSETFSVGKRSFIFGFPATAELNRAKASEATFTQGVVSAIKSSTQGDFNIFQTDAKVSEGSSGGPLIDETGQVVGMVTFQTDEFNRVTGDNFAFALPIEMIVRAMEEVRITPQEGAYGTLFRSGVRSLEERYCEKALADFDAALRLAHPDFVSEHYTEPYLRRCQELQSVGETADTRLAALRSEARSLGYPFLYLLGGSLILFGVLGAAVFWLLRQVRREEYEISALEKRLQQDEIRIRAYRTGNFRRDRRDPHHLSRKII